MIVFGFGRQFETPYQCFMTTKEAPVPTQGTPGLLSYLLGKQIGGKQDVVSVCNTADDML